MAAKKGGGKSQLLWIGVILGLLVLAWLTLSKGSGYGGVIENPSSNQQAQVQSTPKTSAKAAVGGASTNSGPNNFSLSAKEGGELGGSYLLKNISVSRGTGYEAANIFIKPVAETQAFPKYAASISGNIISVTFTDTKNWDIDANAPSFETDNPLMINGKIIKTIDWIVKGEDSLVIKINLKNQAAFSAVSLSNPLTLEVRIQI